MDTMRVPQQANSETRVSGDWAHCASLLGLSDQWLAVVVTIHLYPSKGHHHAE